MGKVWNEEEINFLENYVGSKPLPVIANHLDRTVTAVTIKMKRLGIGNTRENFGMLTVGELANLLKVDRNTVKWWIKKYDLTYKKKVTRNSKRFHFIDTKVFWKWAKENKEKINFRNIEPDSIPPEPDWVRDERLNSKFQKRTYKQWTIQEEKLLRSYIEKKLTYAEIGKKLKRTSISVERHYRRISKKK